MADGLAASELVRRKFPDAVVDTGAFRDQAWIELRAERLAECAEWLRDDRETAFDSLVDVTAVHWPDRDLPIEIVIHLYSYSRNDRLRIKVRVGETGPVPSLSAIAPSHRGGEDRRGGRGRPLPVRGALHLLSDCRAGSP